MMNLQEEKQEKGIGRTRLRKYLLDQGLARHQINYSYNKGYDMIFKALL